MFVDQNIIVEMKNVTSCCCFCRSWNGTILRFCVFGCVVLDDDFLSDDFFLLDFWSSRFCFWTALLPCFWTALLFLLPPLDFLLDLLALLPLLLLLFPRWFRLLLFLLLLDLDLDFFDVDFLEDDDFWFHFWLLLLPLRGLFLLAALVS